MSEESIPTAGRDRSRDAESCDDVTLVQRSLAGDQDAVRRLIERYQRPVLAVLVRMVRDPSLAEDLAQEAFLKAVRSLATYDASRRFASWVFKIAHNTAIDHLRRQRPATVSLESDDPERSSPIDRLETVHAGQQQIAEGRQALAHLEVGLARISPEYREILLLRFREGLSYEELVEVLDVPMGTVKTRLHRARKQLAEELAARGWEVR